MTSKLIGSSATQEGLVAVLRRFFYSDVTLSLEPGGVYSVLNSRGRIDGIRVVVRCGRWRAELVADERTCSCCGRENDAAREAETICNRCAKDAEDDARAGAYMEDASRRR